MKRVMKNELRVLLAVAVLVIVPAASIRAQDAGKDAALSGVISDALCGKKHAMQGMSSADCTRMCVKGGQGFALVVGDKVYSLRGHSADLDKYAGQKVTVKGKLNADTLVVDSVAPAN